MFRWRGFRYISNNRVASNHSKFWKTLSPILINSFKSSMIPKIVAENQKLRLMIDFQWSVETSSYTWAANSARTRSTTPMRKGTCIHDISQQYWISPDWSNISRHALKQRPFQLLTLSIEWPCGNVPWSKCAWLVCFSIISKLYRPDWKACLASS